MRKLIAALCVIGGVVVGSTSPAGALEKIVDERTIGDCPAAVVAIVQKPRLVSSQPFNLSIGAAVGRQDLVPEQLCDTAHDIHVEAYLWFLPIGGGPGSIVATMIAAGDCEDARSCVAFASSVQPPGYYQVVGTVKLLDTNEERTLATPRFLYDGFDITPANIL